MAEADAAAVTQRRRLHHARLSREWDGRCRETSQGRKSGGGRSNTQGEGLFSKTDETRVCKALTGGTPRKGAADGDTKSDSLRRNQIRGRKDKHSLHPHGKKAEDSPTPTRTSKGSSARRWFKGQNLGAFSFCWLSHSFGLGNEVTY